VHAVEPVPRRVGSGTEVSAEPGFLERHLCPRPQRHVGSAEFFHAARNKPNATRCRSPGTISSGDTFIQSRAWSIVGKCSELDRKRSTRNRLATEYSGEFSRNGSRFSELVSE